MRFCPSNTLPVVHQNVWLPQICWRYSDVLDVVVLRDIPPHVWVRPLLEDESVLRRLQHLLRWHPPPTHMPTNDCNLQSRPTNVDLYQVRINFRDKVEIETFHNHSTGCPVTSLYCLEFAFSSIQASKRKKVAVW